MLGCGIKDLPVWSPPGNERSARYLADKSPKFEVVESAGGLLIGARRAGDADNYYWRITQWIMPWYTIIPPFGTASLGGHAWVPIDDETCWTWSMNWHPTRELTERELMVLRVAWRTRARYEWVQHARLAARLFASGLLVTTLHTLWAWP